MNDRTKARFVKHVFAGCIRPMIAFAVLTVIWRQPMVAAEPTLTADKLFDRQHIVDIQIELPEADWDTIRVQSRQFFEVLGKEPAESPFTYVKGQITIDGVLIKEVGIRKKGFLGSLDDHRPSLKVKFSEYKKQSPVIGLDRLTLNNNKQDPSGLSQYIAYKFFNDSGTYAPRCNLAKVTVNGKYLGIYSNVEPVKPAMLERGFGDGSGALFEGTITDFYIDFVEKFEKKNDQAKFGPLRKIADILAMDEVDIEELDKLINIESFVRFWATESLLGFWDGYTNNQNNFFVYRNPADSRFYFIPWGADALFTETMPLPPFFIRPRFVHNKALLANRLYRIPQIQQRYHDTLTQLMEKHWNETELLAEVDLMESMLEDLVRDGNKSFSRSIRDIRRFIKSRQDTLLKEMEDGPVKLRSFARRPAYMKEVGHVTATFETQWYDKTPQDTKELGTVEIELILDGERVEFEKIGVYAEYSKFPPVPAGQPKPPSIIFSGIRKSDGKEITLGIGLPIADFHSTKNEPVGISGLLIVGRVGLFSKIRMGGGEATFENAAMKDGAVVKGKLTFTVTQMNLGGAANR
jgi:spore coat protein CotH